MQKEVFNNYTGKKKISSKYNRTVCIEVKSNYVAPLTMESGKPTFNAKILPEGRGLRLSFYQLSHLLYSVNFLHSRVSSLMLAWTATNPTANDNSYPRKLRLATEGNKPVELHFSQFRSQLTITTKKLTILK